MSEHKEAVRSETELTLKQRHDIYTSAAELMKESTIGCYEEAKKRLAMVGEWKDAESRIAECERKIAAFQAAKKNRSRRALIKAIIFPALLFVALAVYLFFSLLLPRIRYQKAMDAMAAEHYPEAISFFTKLEDFRDSPMQKKIASYRHGQQLLTQGDTARAAMAFGAAGDYLDAGSQSRVLWDGIAQRETLVVESDFTLALKNDGTILFTGNNEHLYPDLRSWTDIIAIDAYSSDIFGLKVDGTLAVGEPDSYDLSDWTDVVAISAGTNQLLALKSDGTVYRAGSREWGLDKVEDWTDIIGIAAGDNYCLGLKADGTVVAAGLYSPLGDKSTVEAPFNTNTWTDVVAIYACDGIMAGLKSDGTAYVDSYDSDIRLDSAKWTDLVDLSLSWNNLAGIKADGTVIVGGEIPADSFRAQIPWANITDVAITYNRIVGLQKDGTLVAIGPNDYNAIGVGGWNQIITLAAGYDTILGATSQGTIVQLSNGWEDRHRTNWTNISSMDVGRYHIIGLRTDGSVVAEYLYYYHDESRKNPTDVLRWKDIIAVAAGDTFSVGLKSDGTVVATGENDYGQCNVSQWKNVTAISAGDYHTVALLNDGTVVATGRNDRGQCDVSGWRNIIAISAGLEQTVGLRSDGTVVSTGDSYDSQNKVSGWRNIIQISTGGNHTVGLRADGTVVATGLNAEGQCDVSGWTNIVQVVAGEYLTVGLRSDGTVVAAGFGKYVISEPPLWSDIKLPRRRTILPVES